MTWHAPTSVHHPAPIYAVIHGKIHTALCHSHLSKWEKLCIANKGKLEWNSGRGAENFYCIHTLWCLYLHFEGYKVMPANQFKMVKTSYNFEYFGELE